MTLVEKLISWYNTRSIKKAVAQKLEQLNSSSTDGTADTGKKSYPIKTPQAGKHDAQVKAYLAQHQSSFSGIGAGWQPYLYEMIDELMDNGLQMEDQVWAKEKYGSFRCGIRTQQPDLQLTFDKIVQAYTAKIDTMCQFCNNKGTHQQFNDWEYNLCLHHYLTFKYDIPYDSEVDYYLGYPNEQEDPSEYRNLSAKPYHLLEEHLFKQQAEALYRLLKEKWPDDNDSIAVVMHRYFDEADENVIALDNQYYKGHLRFFTTDDSGLVVEDTPADYYHRDVMQHGIIEALCKQTP